jgi:hypothetical protein
MPSTNVQQEFSNFQIPTIILSLHFFHKPAGVDDVARTLYGDRVRPARAACSAESFLRIARAELGRGGWRRDPSAEPFGCRPSKPARRDFE